MTEEEVDYVAAAIKEIIYGARKSLSVPVLA
jgi:hypothetical protein